MKTLTVDWLGSCPRCHCSIAVVNTEKGDDKFLFAGDELEDDQQGGDK